MTVDIQENDVGGVLLISKEDGVIDTCTDVQ